MNETIRKLRPAKVKSAVRRRWFERRLGSLTPHEDPSILSLGTAYGGWKIPDGILTSDSICYCVGAGGDISFDLELIRRYGVQVRCFDPVEAFECSALEQAAGNPRFAFRRAAITSHDGTIRMQVHHEAASQSVSAAGLYDSTEWVEAPGRTLPSLMREFGDDHIDLLKLDIEGAEYEVLPTLDLAGMGVRIFATQLHHTGGVRDARSLIDGVRRQGFALVAERPVVKVTFVRRAGV
ncbi:MAG TPA: FkbM family methyltransferase [Solirubrobacteraceae bacterium]|nr:FkbM family methyltransferase [Solirubrobacteraceae bacterium]